VILKLLRECVCEPREAPHSHPYSPLPHFAAHLLRNSLLLKYLTSDPLFFKDLANPNL
jgi:hypothetical protein